MQGELEPAVTPLPLECVAALMSPRLLVLRSAHIPDQFFQSSLTTEQVWICSESLFLGIKLEFDKGTRMSAEKVSTKQMNRVVLSSEMDPTGLQ